MVARAAAQHGVLKREIRTLAAYKYNIFSPYFEATFAYASTPVAAFPRRRDDADEARELVLMPRNITSHHSRAGGFGHLHHVLKFEVYSHLGEDAAWRGAGAGRSGHAAADRRVVWRTGEWCFRGPMRTSARMKHLSWGWDARAARCSSRDLGKVYLDFLGKIHAQLAPLNKRLLFWGDIAENSPELVGILPKDMIAVSCTTMLRPDYTKNLEPFIKSGLETWVAPGVSNWNRVYPNNNEAMGNIRNFVRDGQKVGADGHAEHGVER